MARITARATKRRTGRALAVSAFAGVLAWGPALGQELRQEWRQESVIGSRFVGWLDEADGELIPHIRGNAWITARSTLLFDRGDPYALGLV